MVDDISPNDIILPFNPEIYKERQIEIEKNLQEIRNKKEQNVAILKDIEIQRKKRYADYEKSRQEYKKNEQIWNNKTKKWQKIDENIKNKDFVNYKIEQRDKELKDKQSQLIKENKKEEKEEKKEDEQRENNIIQENIIKVVQERNELDKELLQNNNLKIPDKVNDLPNNQQVKQNQIEEEKKEEIAIVQEINLDHNIPQNNENINIAGNNNIPINQIDNEINLLWENHILNPIDISPENINIDNFTTNIPIWIDRLFVNELTVDERFSIFASLRSILQQIQQSHPDLFSANRLGEWVNHGIFDFNTELLLRRSNFSLLEQQLNNDIIQTIFTMPTYTLLSQLFDLTRYSLQRLIYELENSNSLQDINRIISVYRLFTMVNRRNKYNQEIKLIEKVLKRKLKKLGIAIISITISTLIAAFLTGLLEGAKDTIFHILDLRKDQDKPPSEVDHYSEFIIVNDSKKENKVLFN
jgi:hypothetical protein